MPRPGTDIQITEPTPVRGAILDTGQGFFLVQSERGSTDSAVEIHSLRQYERLFGGRAGGVTSHDSVRVYFTERGGTLYCSRVVGPTSASAKATVGALEVEASSPGTWGNSLTVAIEAPTGLMGAAGALLEKQTKRARSKAAEKVEAEVAKLDEPLTRATTGTLRVVVREGGEVVESSQLISTAGEAVGWSRRSALVNVTAADESIELAAIAPVTLAGGSLDTTLNDVVVEEALDRFPYALGPGQLVFPGQTDYNELLLAHCEEHRRCPLLDLPNTPDSTVVAADVMALWDQLGVRFAAAFGPPAIGPGPAGPATLVTVPYSAVQAGIISRNDRLTGNPNQAAAGVNGISLWATDIVHAYSDEDREQLNELGATLAVIRYGDVRTYGSRTAAGPGEPNWMWFGGSRVVMAIAHAGDAIAERYVHRQIDGGGRLFAELESDLRGLLMRYYQLGALYGDTPAEAFTVDTRSPNTIETIANGEIHALVELKTSPPGEWVVITISKVPIDAALAAAA